jgi:hypothetical protein
MRAVQPCTLKGPVPVVGQERPAHSDTSPDLVTKPDHSLRPVGKRWLGSDQWVAAAEFRPQPAFYLVELAPAFPVSGPSPEVVHVGAVSGDQLLDTVYSAATGSSPGQADQVLVRAQRRGAGLR